jgi:hypothetical protein
MRITRGRLGVFSASSGGEEGAGTASSTGSTTRRLGGGLGGSSGFKGSGDTSSLRASSGFSGGSEGGGASGASLGASPLASGARRSSSRASPRSRASRRPRKGKASQSAARARARATRALSGSPSRPFAPTPPSQRRFPFTRQSSGTGAKATPRAFRARRVLANASSQPLRRLSSATPRYWLRGTAPRGHSRTQASGNISRRARTPSPFTGSPWAPFRIMTGMPVWASWPSYTVMPEMRARIRLSQYLPRTSIPPSIRTPRSRGL